MDNEKNNHKDVNTVKNASHNAQKRFLSQAIELEESASPAIIQTTINMVGLVVFAFLVWAGFTNINEVARTPGEVVPQGFAQVVQHLEGGMIKEIHVREGGVVRNGDPLITLQGSGTNEDYARAQNKALILALQEASLRSFIEGTVPKWSDFESATEEMIGDQKAQFNMRLQSQNQEAMIIKDQIAQKRSMIERYKTDLDTMNKTFDIVKDMYERRKELNKKGYTSDIQFLETQQRFNETQGALVQIQTRINEAKAEISEYKNRLASLDAKQKDEAHRQLEQVLNEKLQNKEVLQKLNDKVHRLVIAAPTDGIVKGMTVNTIGAVIAPGEVVMEIVPMNEELVVQVNIQPQHIGHIKTGQKVQVKFSSFDFSRYGSVEGTLDYISPTTFKNDNGERHYSGRVLLSQNYVGQDAANTVIPGMTVMADIITGDKTILDYMLKPIKRSFQTAFNER